MPVNKRKHLKVLAPEFPPMRCDDGCGECCGPAPATKAELDAVVAYVREHKITPKDQGVTCPLFLDGKCAVYEVRPLICRAFGHVEGLNCNRGYNTNVPPERLEAQIQANGSEETHLIHEVLALVNPAVTARGLLEQIAQAARVVRPVTP